MSQETPPDDGRSDPKPERSKEASSSDKDPSDTSTVHQPDPVEKTSHESEETTANEKSEEKMPRPDFMSVRIRMFNVTCFLYVAMGLLGVFWMNYQNILHARLSFSDPSSSVQNSLLYGAAVALLVVGVGVLVQLFSDWVEAFEKEFAPLLNVFSYAQVPVISFVSAVGEELLFRGALQEFSGLFIAALVFGLLHFPWKRILLPWPFFAFAIGLVFGLITNVTGSLLGPILGHFLINFVNISLIKRRHPMGREEVLDQLLPEEMSERS